MPLMHVDTVGNRFVDALYSGLGGTIYLPGVMRYAAMLVSSQWLPPIYGQSTPY